MNFLGNLFTESKQKNSEKQQVDNTKIICNLREQVELLQKRNTFIEQKKCALVLEAKQKLTGGDKKGALLLLNQKKKVESEIEKNQGSQLLLENQMSALECATINKEVIESLMVGNKAIKQINQELSPDKIDDLMDDIQEETDNYKAIQEAMTQPLQQIYNDDELLTELEELSIENDSNNEKELQNLLEDNGDKAVNCLSLPLPAVPMNTIKENNLELEIKNLEKSMLLS